MLPSGTSSATIRAIRVAESDTTPSDVPPVAERPPPPSPPPRAPALAVPPPGRASLPPLGSIGARRASDDKAIPRVTPVPATPRSDDKAVQRATPVPATPRSDKPIVAATPGPTTPMPTPRSSDKEIQRVTPIPATPRPRTNSPIPSFEMLEGVPDSQPPHSGRPITGRPITGTRSARPTTGPVSVRRKSHGDSDGLEGVDRRGAPRARYATFIRIAAGDRKLDGRSDTISPSGVSVIVNDTLPVGTHATARFALPISDAMVSLPCNVMWESTHRSGGRLIGLSFTLVSFEVEQEIRHYVEAVGELPSDPPPGSGPV